MLDFILKTTAPVDVVNVTRLMVTNFIAITSLIIIFTKVENRYRVENSATPSIVYDRDSLRYFKTFRIILTAAAAAEAAVFVWHGNNFQIRLIGIALFFSGLLLRIGAIKTLGKYWSFHVVRYVDQPLVRTGIYRFISHPAYFGNIYLIGIYLAFGAIFTALVATVLVTWFGIYRVRLERINNLCE